MTPSSVFAVKEKEGEGRIWWIKVGVRELLTCQLPSVCERNLEMQPIHSLDNLINPTKNSKPPPVEPPVRSASYEPTSVSVFWRAKFRPSSRSLDSHIKYDRRRPMVALAAKKTSVRRVMPQPAHSKAYPTYTEHPAYCTQHSENHYTLYPSGSARRWLYPTPYRLREHEYERSARTLSFNNWSLFSTVGSNQDVSIGGRRTPLLLSKIWIVDSFLPYPRLIWLHMRLKRKRVVKTKFFAANLNVSWFRNWK